MWFRVPPNAAQEKGDGGQASPVQALLAPVASPSGLLGTMRPLQQPRFAIFE